jgi:hypothetical protein
VATIVSDEATEALDNKEAEALSAGVELDEGVLDPRLDRLLLGASAVGVADDIKVGRGVLDATELEETSAHARSKPSI